MAINIKFDLLNNPEPPTLILANRNGNKLGQLEVNAESVELVDKFNDASEISFTVNKYVDGKITNLWDKLVDFKLIYCKEWDCWFECTVELDEATESVKTVFCTQLGQAELSQIMLYDIEINTEDDIARDDYKIGILYDPLDSQCILSRLLDKAPHYSIIHVDDTLCNIQRSFSFDGTSIYDAFQEIAEEIGCLFVFNSDSDANGMPQRTISVYDLQQNCLNPDCKYRGEFTDKCPKCGSEDDDGNKYGIKQGYGDDTLIFVTSDELASEGIQLVTDTDSVKNCFKLEAGDDLMTATVRNRNPNGTDYIWYFSDDTKEDMPSELVEKIEKYDKLYSYYYTDTDIIPDGLDSSDIKIQKPLTLNDGLVDNYNGLVEKYKKYYDDEDKGKKLETIPTSIMGFAPLMQAYYNIIDLGWYLKSGLMPNVSMGETDAEKQGHLLSVSLPPLIAVTNLDTVSKATADSAVLAMAKAIVSSHYKVTIKNDSSSLSNGTWSGVFVVTNYSDEEDTYTTTSISRNLTDWDETYVKQKIDKILGKENTDDLSITGLFEKEYDDFCDELHKYALTPLTSFHDACQSCLDILIEQGAGSTTSDLYDSLYLPYFNKLKAIEAEMKVRENEVNTVIALQTDIEKIKVEIQNELNFENYLGEDLWLQFCAYRREDKYSNSNYISDGLNNAELFERALQFYEVAENEIFKSAELQHSISATLNNLLAIPKFKPLVESFKVGNWIRVQIDNKVYKLRLVEYEISYKDFDSISVEFSDVTKTKNGYSDLEDVLSDASSMASSYDGIQRQANLGNQARDMIRQWMNEGLDASLVQIQNNTNEDIVIDNNGLLGRSYSDITEEYSPEQIKLTHNIIAFTDDNWKSVRQAIGKHKYKYFDKGENNFIDVMGYGMSSDFVFGGVVAGSQIIGGDIYSDNYSVTTNEENEVVVTKGSYINLRDGTFSFGGGKITFNGEALTINPDNDLGMSEEQVTKITENTISTTNVKAQNLQVNAANVSGTLTAAEIDASKITSGTINADRLDLSGVATISGLANGATTINGGCITTGTIDASQVTIKNLTIDNLGSISFKDLSDYEEVQKQIDNAGGISTGEATTLITEQLVSSPTIRGGTISGSVIKGNDVNVYGSIQIYDTNYSYNETDGYNYGYCDYLGTIGYLSGVSSGGSTDGIGLYLEKKDNYNTYYRNKCYVTEAGSAIESIRYRISDDEIQGQSKVAASSGTVTIAASTEVKIETPTFAAPTSVSVSSDDSVKHDINYNLDRYDSAYDELLPCAYKYDYGTSNRYHTGFIAQDVKKAIENNGLNTIDLAAYVEYVDDENRKYGQCGLRYEEFIALNTWQIQKLKKRVSTLEEQITALTEQFNKLNVD